MHYPWEFRRDEEFGLFDNDETFHPFGLGHPANPFPGNPLTFGDWWESWRDYGDNRDQEYRGLRHPGTGLPHPYEQGREYQGGHDHPDTNGDMGEGGRYHYNNPVRDRHKKHKHRRAFIWPSDGKRKSTWGRWKDIMEGRGPDIFVGPLGTRPTRNHWKNRFQDVNPNEQGFEESPRDASRSMPWAKRNVADHKAYDFRTRKYCRDNPYTWAEAVWPRRGADQHDFPLSYRCTHGDWSNMRWSPFGGIPLPGHSFPIPRRNRRGLWK
jgi:hypothetical protein